MLSVGILRASGSSGNSGLLFLCGECRGDCVHNKKRKKDKMSYKKPQIVAKSAAKQSFVAGCPEKKPVSPNCYSQNSNCMCGPLK